MLHFLPEQSKVDTGKMSYVLVQKARPGQGKRPGPGEPADSRSLPCFPIRKQNRFKLELLPKFLRNSLVLALTRVSWTLSRASGQVSAPAPVEVGWLGLGGGSEHYCTETWRSRIQFLKLGFT